MLAATWLKIHYECEFNFSVPEPNHLSHVMLSASCVKITDSEIRPATAEESEDYKPAAAEDSN